MNPSDPLIQILKNLATGFPFLLVCIVGAGVVLARWRSFGSGAPLTLAGFSFLVLVQVSFSILLAFMPQLVSGKSASQTANIYIMVRVVMSFANALALVLLLLGNL